MLFSFQNVFRISYQDLRFVCQEFHSFALDAFQPWKLKNDDDITQIFYETVSYS